MINIIPMNYEYYSELAASAKDKSRGKLIFKYFYGYRESFYVMFKGHFLYFYFLQNGIRLSIALVDKNNCAILLVYYHLGKFKQKVFRGLFQLKIAVKPYRYVNNALYYCLLEQDANGKRRRLGAYIPNVSILDCVNRVQIARPTIREAIIYRNNLKQKLAEGWTPYEYTNDNA